MKARNSTRHQTGIGFDSHAFSTRGTLVLGGVRCPGYPALKGHSDGDVLLHALVDALLGAASSGDIGEMFPDTARKFKGASSGMFLKRVLLKIRKKNFYPTHADLIVVAEAPRLSPIKKKIIRKIAGLMKMNPAQINVKGKRPEGLCLFKGPGGLAAWAVVDVLKRT